MRRDQKNYWDKEWQNQTSVLLGGLNNVFEGIRSQILNVGAFLKSVIKLKLKRKKLLITNKTKYMGQEVKGRNRSALVSHAYPLNAQMNRRCTCTAISPECLVQIWVYMGVGASTVCGIFIAKVAKHK